MQKKMRAQHNRQNNKKLHSAIIETMERRLLMSTYTVNTLSDAVNPGTGLLTLRQAVADASADSHADVIAFSPSVFAPGSMHTITLTQGELNIGATTTLNGPGSNVLTIDANKTGRVLQVSSGSSVIVSGLTITNGLVAPAPGQAAYGGAIANAGSLQLNNDTVSNSNASGGSFIYDGTNDSIGEGGAAAGGAIYSTGTLTLNGSLITGNTAAGGSSYGFSPNGDAPNIAQGGGIYSSGNLSISGSTITENAALGGQGGGGDNGGASFGGGVYENGTLTLTASTISSNVDRGGAGAPPLDNASENSGANASGGGIYVTGASDISSVTFSSNEAEGGNSGGGGGSAGAALGGALWSAGPVEMNSTTVTANAATGGAGPYDDSGAGGDGFGGGIYSSASLNISAGSLTNNTATGGDGQAESSEKASGYGGAIYSLGTLTITTSTISGNTAQGDPNTVGGATYAGFGGAGQGGGVFAGGLTTITSSTLSGNTAQGGVGDAPYTGGTGGAGGVANGGGILETQTLTLTDSTVANNSAIGGKGGPGAYEDGNGGAGGAGLGGGVFVATQELYSNDSTISGNTVAGGAGGDAIGSGYINGGPGAASGGGIALGNGFAILSNSIVDANTSTPSTEDDIFGSIATDSQNNLIGTGGGPFISNGTNGNIVGVTNPLLSPLGNYGGPTQTMLPLYNSPAVNAGSNSLIPTGITTDQRGYARVAGSTVDIGADELQSATVSGLVFNDLNGDGIQESGETGLAGVTVYADLSNSGYFQSGDPTATTNASGNFTIAGMPEGTVIIRQKLPAGYRQSYPVGGTGDHVTVTPAGIKGALFADSTRLYISGSVSLNGVGQGGVVVYADLNNDGKFESNENNKTTASDGTFAFQSLAAGTYTFRIVPPPAGEIISGNAAITVTLGSGGVDTGLSFTLAKQTTAQLTGTVIGTSGSYNNQGNTAAKAFDGNLSTYFDAPTPSGSWAGLNLGSPQIITQISYAPRSGWASRMVGGMFQGSNSPTFSSGVVTLYTVTSTPATGVLTTVPISNTTAYQYVRYIGPANGYCNVAEVEFFGHAPTAATLVNGVLSITGTTGADNVTISLTPSSDIVTVNGVSQTFVPSQVSSVNVTTLDGNDTVSITGNDSTGTQHLPTVAVQSGNGNDVLTENLNGDGSGNDPGAFVTMIAGNGNDSFNISGSSIDASVTAGNGSDTFGTTISGSGNMHATLNAGDGNDAMTAGNSGGLGSEEIVFNAGIGVDTILNTDEDDYVAGTLGGQAYSLIPAEQELLGNVYQDQNGDGKYETGEPLSANAPVLFNNTTDGTFGTKTDSTGHYLLNVFYNSNVPPVSTYGWTSPITLSSQNNQGELISGIDFALPKPLSGNVIGTSGSYNNQGNTAANAFDGNLSTYFDAPAASGSWVGLDLGSPQVVTQVEYAPRSGWASRMLGGEIQASNSANFSSGVVTLYTINAAPPVGVLTTGTLNNTSAYRYYRYIGPTGGYCNIAELEFEG